MRKALIKRTCAVMAATTAVTLFGIGTPTASAASRCVHAAAPLDGSIHTERQVSGGRVYQRKVGWYWSSMDSNGRSGWACLHVYSGWYAIG
jgi:hypothetical protein